MSILGFGTSQTFESISYDEICNAFLTKSGIAMGTRKRAKSKMKAQYIYIRTALQIRVRPRFFDQVGHQTTNASIGNKYFFTK